MSSRKKKQKMLKTPIKETLKRHRREPSDVKILRRMMVSLPREPNELPPFKRKNLPHKLLKKQNDRGKRD